MNAVDDEFETFSLDQVKEITGCPSPDWITRLIYARKLTAVRSGKEWRMTHSDMVRVVAHMRAAAEAALAERDVKRATTGEPACASTNAAGLTARGAARMRRRT